MGDTPYDVAVVGGGITGVGAAHVLARAARYSVVLLERGRCGGGTSANSHHVIHGGFRYLKSGSVARTVTSARCLARLLRSFPARVRPLPCVMPLAPGGAYGGRAASAAAGAYGFLHRMFVGGPGGAEVLGRDEAEAREPLLAGRAPYGALSWTDGLLTDHDGLVRDLIAAAPGLEVREGTDVTAAERRGDVILLRTAGGESVACRTVVDATGSPGSLCLRNLSLPGTPPAAARPLSGCRAFNVVIPALPAPSHGIGVRSREGRLYFAVPRAGRLALGTGYLRLEGHPEPGHPESGRPAEGGDAPAEGPVPARAVDDFLDGFDGLLDLPRLTSRDVGNIESGVLPAAPGSGGARPAERDVITAAGGVVRITPAKYTTFLASAAAAEGHVARILGR